MRRVIKQDCELPGLGFRVPHRKSYVISGSRIRPFIEPEELSLPGVQYIPETVILIAEPKEADLVEMNRDDLFRWTWRLLFHARVHTELDRQVREGELTNADVRSRIDRIGQVEIDEARAVLRKEHFLIGNPNSTEVYIEFAALYLEYLYFSPWRLPWYFSSLTDLAGVETILSENFQPRDLLEQTRQGNVDTPFLEVDPPTGSYAIDQSKNREDITDSPLSVTEQTPISEEALTGSVRMMKLAEQAESSKQRGNTVRAAMSYLQASRHGDEETTKRLEQRASNELNHLAQRFQKAVELNDREAGEWRAAMLQLLTRSSRGFWNPDRRLLYDLQKVCIDHERDVFRIDLMEPVRSLGKRPIKRALRNQREVLMVKHLRSALRRLNAGSLPESERKTLSHLLHTAVASTERQLRTRLRPAVETALKDAGFQPANLPERVANKKMVEELLDAIAHRGYLTMGVLRDCISRNQLKLPNLGNPLKLITGDRLLKADRRLASEIDGVYRRGEFYLRWLQRLSSLAFGTVIGRLLTLYLFLPFGGAYVALMGILHLLEKVHIHAHGLTDIEPVVATGIFLLGVMHWRGFRDAVATVLSYIARGLGSVLIDMPAWAIRNPAIRRFLRSPGVVFTRRFIITPLLFTIVFCFAIPWLGLYRQASLSGSVIVYFAFTAVLNTRIGRDVEEITADWIDQTWHHIRTHFFVALFEVIMWAFKALLELFERFMYAVDEWLRFKSGESQFVFWTKAVAGFFWGIVSFVMMFFITLLAEPQLNPVKHFPVVTVSHKIILPLEYPGGLLSQAILPLVGSIETAQTIAGSVIFLIPGVFGFLVWELRSNWRLYSANRPKNLSPVLVGSHGETMIRLMKPGFHSGTLPKLFGKMRRIGRRDEEQRDKAIPGKYRDALHHIGDSIRHFVDREFLGLLRESNALSGRSIRISRIRTSSNSISVELVCHDSGEKTHSSQAGNHSSPMVIVFQEQSGWLVAGVREAGWLIQLDETELERLTVALLGLYHLSGVDVVREQILELFETPDLRYDIDERDLVVWPDETYAAEWRFNLDTRPDLVGSSNPPDDTMTLTTLSAEKVLFVEQSQPWKEWVAYWDAIAAGETQSELPTVDLNRYAQRETIPK
jgi:hypothetical protein